jgi:hypothetical protein
MAPPVEADPDERSVLHPQPSGSLHLHEEELVRIGGIRNLEPPPSESAILDFGAGEVRDTNRPIPPAKGLNPRVGLKRSDDEPGPI